MNLLTCDSYRLMEQSSSWETYTHSATQEILRTLRNQKVHYRVEKSPSLDSSLDLTNPVHILKWFDFKINSVLSLHLCWAVPNDRDHLGIQTEFHISPTPPVKFKLNFSSIDYLYFITLQNWRLGTIPLSLYLKVGPRQEIRHEVTFGDLFIKTHFYKAYDIL